MVYGLPWSSKAHNNAESLPSTPAIFPAPTHHHRAPDSPPKRSVLLTAVDPLVELVSIMCPSLNDPTVSHRCRDAMLPPRVDQSFAKANRFRFYMRRPTGHLMSCSVQQTDTQHQGAG